MTWNVAAGVRLAVLVALLASPPAHGLALVEDTETEERREVRVALDRGELEAKTLSGQPRVDGDELPASWTRIGDAPSPWKGFERTVVLDLEGVGRLMLADDASGLVLALGAANHTDGGSEDGEREGPATGPGDPPGGQGTANGTQALGRPALEAAEGQNLTGTPGRALPPTTSSQGEEHDEGGTVDWLLVALVVGLGLVAVAPAVAGPIKRRLWQLGSVLWRVRRRHQRRGPRKP